MKTPWEWKDKSFSIPESKGVAWYNTLDGRYRIEVWRTIPYEGILKIFDHEKNDEEIFSKEVGIAFDARFGPDVADVDDWGNWAIEFVDTVYAPVAQ